MSKRNALIYGIFVIVVFHTINIVGSVIVDLSVKYASQISATYHFGEHYINVRECADWQIAESGNCLTSISFGKRSTAKASYDIK